MVMYGEVPHAYKSPSISDFHYQRLSLLHSADPAYDYKHEYECNETCSSNHTQYKQRAYNVTMKRVRVTTVAVGKQ